MNEAKKKIELELKLKRMEKFNSLEPFREYRRKYETNISALTHKRDIEDKYKLEQNKLCRKNVQEK